MSPRAAWRLESLGFDLVFDYVAGKVDWLAFGLPTEGVRADVLRAGDVVRTDVPTCGLDDLVGAVHERVQRDGWTICAVVNDKGILLGALRTTSWEEPESTRAEDAMREGPPTIRPSEELAAVATRLVDRSVGAIFVADSNGRLIGLLQRHDALKRLEQAGIELFVNPGETSAGS